MKDWNRPCSGKIFAKNIPSTVYALTKKITMDFGDAKRVLEVT